MANASLVTSVVVGAGNRVTAAQQTAGSVTVTGILDAPLAAGEAVEIVLPNGQVAQGVPTPDGLGFSFTASLLLAETFGVGGTVSAYVLNAQQVKGPVTTQNYAADSQRSLVLITAVLTGQFFVPVGFAGGNASGSQGLLSELDQTNGPLNLQPFGKGGQFEAKQASLHRRRQQPRGRAARLIHGAITPADGAGRYRATWLGSSAQGHLIKCM